jgi:uncharacterized membrane protein
VLPVIGLLERYGLQQRARAVIGGFRARRQGVSSSSTSSIARSSRRSGSIPPPATRRPCGPLVAPMAVAAAEQQTELDEASSEKVKAYAAATDNVGLFFGEDIFFAIGSIVLIQQTLEAYDIILSPLELAVWAIPTAIAAFIIHGARLLMLDRSLGKARR